MRRRMKPIACIVYSLDTTNFAGNPVAWMLRQPSVGEPAWLLAHADDGVIWGVMHDGKLLTSNDVFPHISPPLRIVTLQQVRLFGAQAEVRVWREGDSFKACRLEDRLDEHANALDEEQILWGTRCEDPQHGFTLLVDGRQGLRHAAPIDIPSSVFNSNKKHRPARLVVRHYVTYNDVGQARIFLSRLTGLYYTGDKT